QVVRSYDLSSFSAGYHQLIWNGRTAMGQPLASGVYFAIGRFTGNSGETRLVKQKMVLLK
ncbi:MAG: hypothetical protein GY869_05820, partial [Planctomycetes bacterium]|nr:hypothetical protein [Planctomycetota bacterium]